MGKIVSFENPLVLNMDVQDPEKKKSTVKVITIPYSFQLNQQQWWKLALVGYFGLLLMVFVISVVAMTRVGKIQERNVTEYLHQIDDLTKQLRKLEQDFNDIPTLTFTLRKSTREIISHNFDTVENRAFNTSLQRTLDKFKTSKTHHEYPVGITDPQYSAIQSFGVRATDLVEMVFRRIAWFVEQETVFQRTTLNRTTDWLRDGQKQVFEVLNSSVLKLKKAVSLLRKEKIASFDPSWLTPYNGHQYQVIKSFQNWEASRNICISKGGDLAVHGMRDYETRVRIATILTNQKVRTWIGLHDLNEEGFYQWIDGVNATDGNTFWKPGEPSIRNSAERDCGQILPSHRQYTTDDENCKANRRALCEREII